MSSGQNFAVSRSGERRGARQGTGHGHRHCWDTLDKATDSERTGDQSSLQKLSKFNVQESLKHRDQFNLPKLSKFDSLKFDPQLFNLFDHQHVSAVAPTLRTLIACCPKIPCRVQRVVPVSSHFRGVQNLS